MNNEHFVYSVLLMPLLSVPATKNRASLMGLLDISLFSSK